MFSGLIGDRGEVVALEMHPTGGATLRIRAESAASEGVATGDSVSVNGVCLTVAQIDGGVLRFDVVPETLARSTLGMLRGGNPVNVEYSLRAGDRLGGHIVYGHVDAIARVLARRAEGQGERVRIETPRELQPMIAEKGFITVDGVSLTIAAIGPEWFEVALVPETIARTTLGTRAAESLINIEVDPIARYVAHVALP